MEPVRRYGSRELAAEVLGRVATGELHVAFGVTEPEESWRDSLASGAPPDFALSESRRFVAGPWPR